MAGYSRLMAADEEGTLAQLKVILQLHHDGMPRIDPHDVNDRASNLHADLQ
jgi:hypothetical protein